MSSASISAPGSRANLLRPILVGGALAGTFDLISAFITFGLGNPRIIAGGLLGKQALQGGAGTWIIGLLNTMFSASSSPTWAAVGYTGFP